MNKFLVILDIVKILLRQFHHYNFCDQRLLKYLEGAFQKPSARLLWSKFGY